MDIFNTPLVLLQFIIRVSQLSSNRSLNELNSVFTIFVFLFLLFLQLDRTFSMDSRGYRVSGIQRPQQCQCLYNRSVGTLVSSLRIHGEPKCWGVTRCFRSLEFFFRSEIIRLEGIYNLATATRYH